MARIKHIAIATDDPEATAKFYVEGLGMKQVGKLDTPTDEGYYLTDGYINLAILKFKTEEEANTEGGPKWTGMHHFGFNVETMPEAEEKILKAGATLKRKPKEVDGKPNHLLDTRQFRRSARYDRTKNDILFATVAIEQQAPYSLKQSVHGYLVAMD